MPNDTNNTAGSDCPAASCSAYLCIQGGTAEELGKRVNNAMEAGFKPYGHPISHGGYIVQAMTYSKQNEREQP